MSFVLFLRNAGIGTAGMAVTIARIALQGTHRIAKLPAFVPKPSKSFWILGNGPSLTEVLKQTPFPWEEEDFELVVVNHFSDSAYFTQLKPSFYVLSAPELLWTNPKLMRGDYLQSRERLFNTLAEKVNWPMTLLLPARAKKERWFKDILKKNLNIKLRYYSHLPADGPMWFKQKMYAAQWGTPRPHNVLIPAIMSMLWLGAGKIRLLGAEHSWLPSVWVDNENNVRLNHQHFYDAGKRENLMYREGQEQRKLHEVLEKFYYTFKSYWEIRNLADSNGIEIVNYTENSFIDAFPKRVNY